MRSFDAVPHGFFIASPVAQSLDAERHVPEISHNLSVEMRSRIDVKRRDIAGFEIERIIFWVMIASATPIPIMPRLALAEI